MGESMGRLYDECEIFALFTGGLLGAGCCSGISSLTSVRDKIPEARKRLFSFHRSSKRGPCD
jgi:hypothetical protein